MPWRVSDRTGTQALFERYYFSRPGYVGGTADFHELCRANLPKGGRFLEIGAGPPNTTTHFLASLGSVTGVDVSDEVMTNRDLTSASVFDGTSLPFTDASFDGCVSNYVLEHVGDPSAHFREVARVLRPGGHYVIRTPNLFHYVAGASWLLPHSAHVFLAKRLRGQTAEDHDPWETHYRANSASTLGRLARDSGLRVATLRMVEKEPSYGRASPLLFYPMMLYERIVNSSDMLGTFRSSIVAAFQKPA